MRLINVKTQALEEFVEGSIPDYSILSHTWSDDEVTYKDLSKRPEEARRKKGWWKIEQCCRQSFDEGILYSWVDTCCINKTSSAELSEAINSMYKWYRRADICYAYLADIEEGPNFGRSRWFTRGWTLQELLAPYEVVFFNKSWELIGRKTELITELAAFTRIHQSALLQQQKNTETLSDSFESYSVGERMSWASERETTRIEDRAYSLLGLFNVNMPLVYGEGSKAFFRLQLEILKQTDDPTIFTYGLYDSRYGSYDPNMSRGVFADDPSLFRWSQVYSKQIMESSRSSRPNPMSCQISGQLLKLRASIFPLQIIWSARGHQCHLTTEDSMLVMTPHIQYFQDPGISGCHLVVALLDCVRLEDDGKGGHAERAGIILAESQEPGVYDRIHGGLVSTVTIRGSDAISRAKATKIYVRASSKPRERRRKGGDDRGFIRIRNLEGHRLMICPLKLRPLLLGGLFWDFFDSSLPQYGKRYASSELASNIEHGNKLILGSKWAVGQPSAYLVYPQGRKPSQLALLIFCNVNLTPDGLLTISAFQYGAWSREWVLLLPAEAHTVRVRLWDGLAVRITARRMLSQDEGIKSRIVGLYNFEIESAHDDVPELSLWQDVDDSDPKGCPILEPLLEPVGGMIQRQDPRQEMFHQIEEKWSSCSVCI